MVLHFSQYINNQYRQLTIWDIWDIQQDSERERGEVAHYVPYFLQYNIKAEKEKQDSSK